MTMTAISKLIGPDMLVETEAAAIVPDASAPSGEGGR